MHNMGATTY